MRNIKLSLNAEFDMNNRSDMSRVGKGPFDYYVKTKNDLIVTVPSMDNIENSSGRSSASEIVDDNFDYKDSDAVDIEANKDIETSNFTKVFGQLVAQMLDTMGSSRERSAADMMNGVSSGNNRLCVKGILSTGRHKMFFTLSQATDDPKPVLHYYGDYQVDVLTKIEKLAKINETQVRRFLKALFCFVKYDLAHNEKK